MIYFSYDVIDHDHSLITQLFRIWKQTKMMRVRYIHIGLLVIVVSTCMLTVRFVLAYLHVDTLPRDMTTLQCPSVFKPLLNYPRFQQEAEVPSRNDRTDYNILILTPFASSAWRLGQYLKLLCTLTYPHKRISVALGHDAGVGLNMTRTFEMALDTLRPYFRRVTFYELEQPPSNISHRQRHDKPVQRMRRRHLAQSRNELLSRAMMGDHDWVLWLDVDLGLIPPDLIQLLLSPNQPIVTPACVQYEPFRTYDRNTWRETARSRDHIAEQKAIYGEDFLMMEYTKETLRNRLVDLRHEGTVVPVDGVGGCCLLINASCHRQGLIFPPFVFDSHIETEGLAKMAAKMGFPVYGLPFVQVFHDMVGMYEK